MRLSSLLLLVTAPALLAQAPAAEPSLAQRLRTERPEIERLLGELQPREAMARAEALLPQAKPAFDNTDARTQVQSHFHFLACSQAYYLAFKAANAAGHWEKALDYIRKAKEAGDENYKVVKAAFPADLPGGDGRILAQSLKKLAALPDDVTVHAGHNESTTIGNEKRTNFFMQQAAH